jgi:hypothetical protein
LFESPAIHGEFLLIVGTRNGAVINRLRCATSIRPATSVWLLAADYGSGAVSPTDTFPSQLASIARTHLIPTPLS